jgi:hypothetical protein
MSKYTNNLFESIKEALNKKSTTENSSYKDILKLEIGNTYVVRLVPNVENPERTLYHYYNHIWKSVLTNQLVSTLCPTTYGERCPIDEYRSKVYQTKDEAKIKEINPIRRDEKWLANVYVVKDPTNPDNQGQVKILRFGKQIYNIIDQAMSGDDAEEFGARIFDLSDKGCNLRIKVDENQGGYANYTTSKFMSPSALEGAPDVDEIYAACKNLESLQEHKSYEDIQKLLKVHFLGEEEAPVVNNYDLEDEEEAYVAPIKATKVSSEDEDHDDTTSTKEAQIEDILKDL